MMRDRIGVLASGLPIWCAGIAAPSSVNGLTFVGWQEPIGCGGVAVFPGDVIVADGDGAICIPAAQAERVAKEGPEQELFETWLVSEVEKGAKLPGLYPPNEENKAKYAAWRAKK
jgi:regulator of RNase E activity RraA